MIQPNTSKMIYDIRNFNSDLVAAIQQIGAESAILVIPGGVTVRVTSPELTVPDNIVLSVKSGGTIRLEAIDNDVRLSIEGGVDAGPYRIFQFKHSEDHSPKISNITVDPLSGDSTKLYADWFVVGDGVSDDSFEFLHSLDLVQKSDHLQTLALGCCISSVSLSDNIFLYADTGIIGEGSRKEIKLSARLPAAKKFAWIHAGISYKGSDPAPWSGTIDNIKFNIEEPQPVGLGDIFQFMYLHWAEGNFKIRNCAFDITSMRSMVGGVCLSSFKLGIGGEEGAWNPGRDTYVTEISRGIRRDKPIRNGEVSGSSFVCKNSAARGASAITLTNADNMIFRKNFIQGFKDDAIMAGGFCNDWKIISNICSTTGGRIGTEGRTENIQVLHNVNYMTAGWGEGWPGRKTFYIARGTGDNRPKNPVFKGNWAGFSSAEEIATPRLTCGYPGPYNFNLLDLGIVRPALDISMWEGKTVAHIPVTFDRVSLSAAAVAEKIQQAIDCYAPDRLKAYTIPINSPKNLQPGLEIVAIEFVNPGEFGLGNS